jgi:drug/metabolite transporter (DMT)-like permease
MIGGMILIGFIDNYVAVVAGQISLWQFQLARTIPAALLIVLLSKVGFGTLRPVRLWAVGVRSLLIALAMLFYFGSLAFMPIAQSLAGLFTSPIFVLLIAVFWRDVKIGPWRVVAVVMGFIGILFVLKPDPANLSWVLLMPVAGGFFYALGSTATRALCEGEQTLVMLMGLMVIQGAVGAVMLVALGWIDPVMPAGADGFLLRPLVWPMWEAVPIVLLQAVGSVAGVGLITKAYQIGEVSQVAVFEYSVMIFGPLFAFILFGQHLGALQALGIALIMTAGIIIALRSR